MVRVLVCFWAWEERVLKIRKNPRIKMTIRDNLPFIIFTLKYKYLYPIHAPKTRGMILGPLRV
jgi:hypothetical protein